MANAEWAKQCCFMECFFMIEVKDLTKAYGFVHAVKGVSFAVGKGELFGFLGPNGAGKTTTINMLIGLARPDSGTIRIAGIDCSVNPKAAQRLMGIVPDESNLYPELTGFENLCFCGALYGMTGRNREARAHFLLDQFGLSDAAERKFGGYSRGMKRKLTIAAGIIHEPPLLFLDEPTTGIDVAAARQIRQIITNLNASGVTIFMTTHYIEEAERLCRRIAFIVEGSIVQIDTIDNLMRQTGGQHIVEFAVSTGAADICGALSGAFPSLQCQTVSDAAIRITSTEPVRIGPLLRFMEERGAEVSEARKIRPSLEDVFVRITGIEASEMKREREKIQKGADA
jgi:ABC-2 type transport system ATP-binding protein